MPARSLNDIFFARRPGARTIAPAATLTAVYSGRDVVSRSLDRRATLWDLVDMLPPGGSPRSGTLTYVRVVVD